jgi:hypothetical protein
MMSSENLLKKERSEFIRPLLIYSLAGETCKTDQLPGRSLPCFFTFVQDFLDASFNIDFIFRREGSTIRLK